MLRYPSICVQKEKKRKPDSIDKEGKRQTQEIERKTGKGQGKTEQLAHKNNLVEEISQSHTRQTSGRIGSG